MIKPPAVLMAVFYLFFTIFVKYKICHFRFFAKFWIDSFIPDGLFISGSRCSSADCMLPRCVSADEYRAGAGKRGLSVFAQASSFSVFWVSARYFSSFRFTRCSALSMDFTCRPSVPAIS